MPNGRWFYEKEFEDTKDKFAAANDDIVDKVSEEKGSELLLKLIKSIPRIKFRLTPDQEVMIKAPENLLCLGRSGTGKTTSSALRLFSTDLLYKYVEEFEAWKKIRKAGEKFQVKPDFVDQQSNLRLIFVTASPVLTNEVKKFYQDMKEHVKEELKRRAEAKALKAASSSKNEAGEEESKAVDNENILDADAQTETTNDESHYLMLEELALADEEELEKQLDLPNSFGDVCSDHFPMFLTVKRLIYMMDASLDFPFFSRGFDGQIVGMDSNVQWHNESKGVLMIN